LVVALLVLLATGTGRAQTPQTMRLMREKLARSSALLAALVKSDWATMRRESRELAAIPDKPGWEVFQFPEYTRDSRAFTASVQALVDASNARDQAAALKAYNGIVTACVECHRNVARRRLVQGTDLQAP
jgi:cytochrome c553